MKEEEAGEKASPQAIPDHIGGLLSFSKILSPSRQFCNRELCALVWDWALQLEDGKFSNCVADWYQYISSLASPSFLPSAQFKQRYFPLNIQEVKSSLKCIAD